MTLFDTINRHVDDSLENETTSTLSKMILADLIALCHERGLPADGNKDILVTELLEWKQFTRPVPAPSTPRLLSRGSSLSSGPMSNNDRESVMDSQYLATLFLTGNEAQIKFEKLKYGKKLGSGGFKDCYAGVYNEDAVAIGELRTSQFTRDEIKEIKHEIDVLKQLRHENITRYIGVCTNPQHLCIVTELCENGDLFDYMRKAKRPSFSQQVMFMHDIALGVSYLHTRRPSIIHRDLKSMNILISGDIRAKINDFGLARIRPRANSTMHTQCGTPNWQAPEYWSSTPSYTEKVDIYACALIFWEILTWAELGYPYQSMTEHILYEQVRDHNYRPPLKRLENRFPQPLLALIQKMWLRDPKDRPSMSYVVDQLAQYLE